MQSNDSIVGGAGVGISVSPSPDGGFAFIGTVPDVLQAEDGETLLGEDGQSLTPE